MRRLALALPLLFACGAGASSSSTSSQDIEGGYAWGGDYAVGLIGFASGGVCTGTLIAPDVVLTAAHCIVNTEHTGFYLGAGAPIPSTADDPAPAAIPPGMTKYAIDKVAIYPGFDLNEVENGHPNPNAPDLGVLHLATPVPKIPPQKVPSADEVSAVLAALVPGKLCWVVGYGRHDVAGVTTVKEKRAAEVTIASVTASEIVVRRADNPNGGIVDEGDSGGPLLCAIPGMADGWPWRIVGTVSYAVDVGSDTSENHENHQEEHYVRTDPYAAWIDGAITSFPVEERCVASANFTLECKGQSLRYCDGERYKVMRTCADGETCDAKAGTCKKP